MSSNCGIFSDKELKHEALYQNRKGSHIFHKDGTFIAAPVPVPQCRN